MGMRSSLPSACAWPPAACAPPQVALYVCMAQQQLPSALLEDVRSELTALLSVRGAGRREGRAAHTAARRRRRGWQPVRAAARMRAAWLSPPRALARPCRAACRCAAAGAAGAPPVAGPAGGRVGGHAHPGAVEGLPGSQARSAGHAQPATRPPCSLVGGLRPLCTARGAPGTRRSLDLPPPRPPSPALPARRSLPACWAPRPRTGPCRRRRARWAPSTRACWAWTRPPRPACWVAAATPSASAWTTWWAQGWAGLAGVGWEGG
jgi:hypothetical protein